MGEKIGGKSTRKTLPFFVILCFCVAVFAITNAILLFKNSSDFSVAFCCLAAVLTAVFCCLILFVFKQKISITAALIISASVLAVCYMFIFPPITAPDEQAHYLSAYRISNYILFDFSADNTSMLMRGCDADLFKNLSTDVSGEYIKTIYGNAQFFAHDTDKVLYECTFVNNAPLAYILSAFGIAVARIAKLGALPAMLAGRFMNIAAFIAMLIYSAKKIPFGKNVLPMISTLPIVLHLAASFSYDAIIIGFAFVFVSQVLYIREKDGFVTVKDILVLTIFAMLLAPSKIVYFPLVFMVFIIPNSKFKISAKKAILLKSLIVLISVIMLLGFQLSTVASASTKATSGWSDQPPYNIAWILTNPFSAVKVVLNTLISLSHFYIRNLFGGLLGWLNVEVPYWLWIPQMLLLLTSFVRHKNQSGIFNKGEKILVWLCIIASAGLVMLSMFISWTPLGSDIIYGVQGRYFLPLLLPVFAVLRCKRLSISENLEKYVSMLYMSFGFITVMNVFLTVTV